MRTRNTQGINKTRIPEFPIATNGSNTVIGTLIFSARSRRGSTARVRIKINKIPTISIRGFVIQRIYSERAIERTEKNRDLFTAVKPPSLNYHIE